MWKKSALLKYHLIVLLCCLKKAAHSIQVLVFIICTCCLILACSPHISTLLTARKLPWLLFLREVQRSPMLTFQWFRNNGRCCSFSFSFSFFSTDCLVFSGMFYSFPSCLPMSSILLPSFDWCWGSSSLFCFYIVFSIKFHVPSRKYQGNLPIPNLLNGASTQYAKWTSSMAK